MSILSSTKSGLEFYKEQLKEWYINAQNVKSFACHTIKDIDIQQEGNKIYLVDRENSISVCSLNSLPSILEQYDIRLMYGANYSRSADNVKMLAVHNYNTNLIKTSLGARFLTLTQCNVDTLDGLLLEDLVFPFGKEFFAGIGTGASKIGSMKNCNIASMRAYTNVYSKNMISRPCCSLELKLDNIENCDFGTLMITKAQLLDGNTLCNGKLTYCAQEMLDRFYSRNKCTVLMLTTWDGHGNDNAQKDTIVKDGNEYKLL